MDPLAASAVAQTQAMVQNQAGIAMLKKTVDIMAQQGAELAKMISQQAGVGQQVDLQA
jgi:hypothetical protein